MTTPLKANVAPDTDAPPTAVVVRHLLFEDLGLIGPVLHRHGFEITYLDAGVDHDLGAVETADLAVVLGGPIGANDGDRYPCIDQEIAVLRRRLARGLPTLGVCLGAQLIARALGAGVAPSGHFEIGYGALTLTREGQDSVLAPLQNLPVLHWHNDRFEIPAGATRLAATTRCDNQAFTVGRHVLALQFHLETPPQDIERWLIGHAEALATAGTDLERIREDAVIHGPALATAAEEVIDRWLTGARPSPPTPRENR